jgi:hypothetical protein
MEADRIDIDLLIDEIEKRPAIWNFECPDYKNRVLKKSHWEALVEMFGDSGDNTEKKKVFGMWFICFQLFTIIIIIT